MKHNKKNKGFTIIETLFSLLLIALALVSIAQTISFAFDALRKSSIRFNMQQKIESFRNELVSKSFNDKELEEGSYDRSFSTAAGPFDMKWEIKILSPTLKLIELSITYKQITKKAYFYKSQYIKNNQPTEGKND